MSWIDKKYIMMLSNTLPKFKQKSSELWNFRCPYCNDSQHNKHKSRGYIFQKKGKYFYYCHNCSMSLSFEKFLKFINQSLYDSYLLEKFENSKTELQTQSPKLEVKFEKKEIKLRKVSQLDYDHVCKKYLIKRQIPTTYHSKLYYCENFKKWVNTMIPNKFNNLDNDSPRLIIPLYSSDNVLMGFQGRSLKPNEDEKLRYITIMLGDEYPKVYNIENCDFNKTYYVVEGPFDAMFIPNTIATCGGKLSSEIDRLNRMKQNAVIVYDNEPRNKEVAENILTSIKKGYRVCIWPSSTIHKDINEMILAKVKGDYIKTELIAQAAERIKIIIDDNTYSGLEAELKFMEWKKT